MISNIPYYINSYSYDVLWFWFPGEKSGVWFLSISYKIWAKNSWKEAFQRTLCNWSCCPFESTAPRSANKELFWNFYWMALQAGRPVCHRFPALKLAGINTHNFKCTSQLQIQIQIHIKNTKTHRIQLNCKKGVCHNIPAFSNWQLAKLMAER